MEFRLSKKKEHQSIVFGIVFLVSFLLVLGCSSSVPEVVDENSHNSEALAVDNSQSTSDSSTVASNTNSVAGRNAVDKVFTLTGQNFKFVMNGKDNPDLRVKVGDKVRIEFTSTEGFHDWKVDEFNAVTSRVKAGDSTSVEFIVDKAGTFDYYCSVGSHRQLGMEGKLIVE